MLELADREKFILKPLIKKHNSKFRFEYLVCSCSANTRMKFLGVWRPFLRQLLEVYSVFKRQSKEYIINSQVLFGKISDRVSIIEEIFGLKQLARGKLMSKKDGS